MNSLFHEVLSMSLSAGFLVAIIIGLRWCFRRSPKWVHCALWALVAVRLVFPSLPESELSMVPQNVSDSEYVVQFVAEMPQPGPQEPKASAETPTVQAPAPSPLPQNTPIPVEEKEPIDWMTVFCRVWLAGIGLMGLYGLFSYLRVKRRVAPSVDIGGGVSLCDYIDTPFLLGLFRPRIYLPSELNSETAAYVLSHERAHLKRRDHWWKPLGFVLLSIHWFNPMIWLGYILLCRDIEMACDEAVIRTMGIGDIKGYSSALLECSLPRRIISICPLAFGEVDVRDRIKSVLNYKKPALWLSVAGIAAVVLGAVFFLTDPIKDEEDVTFYHTAQYQASTNILTLYEYDADFNQTSVTMLYDGKTYNRIEYDRRKEGDILITTEVFTQHAIPELPYSKDSVTETVTHQKMDADGNVIEEQKFRDGELISTILSTYDKDGNCILAECTTPGSGWTREYTYDRRGNQLSAIFSIDFDGNGEADVTQKFLSTYDRKDRLLTSEIYTDDTLDSSAKYTYDEETNAQICEEFDALGTSLGKTTTYYTDHGEILSTVVGEEPALCFNYVGSDGSRSIGIPEEIYVEPIPEVEYYPTAAYHGDTDQLYLYEYDKEFRTTLRLYYEKGELRRRSEFSYEEKGDTLITTVRSTDYSYAYNSNGVETIEQESEEVTHKKTDADGNVLEEIVYQDGKLYTTTKFTYDENGNMVVRKRTSDLSASEQINTYDESGNLLHRVDRYDWERDGVMDSNRDISWTYDENGNALTEEWYEDGNFISKTACTFDDQGRLLTRESTDSEGPGRMEHVTYDDKENVKYHDVSGTSVGSSASYYDDHGNLLRYIQDDGQFSQYRNYIGTDGSKSIGIPKEVYTEGGEITAHPEFQPKEAEEVEPFCTLEVLDADPAGARLRWHLKQEVKDVSVNREFTLRRVTGSGWQPLEPNFKTSQTWDEPTLLGELTYENGEYTADFSVSWVKMYGLLPPGTYRISTTLSDTQYNTWYAEFTIPEHEDSKTREAIEDCYDALSKLADGDYQVETTYGPENFRDVNAKSGYNYLSLRYSEDGLYPLSGAMRYSAVSYERIKVNGSWAFNEGDMDPNLLQWYTRYIHNQDQLSLLDDNIRDGVREVTFQITPFDTLTDRSLTFWLSKNGELLGLVESSTLDGNKHISSTSTVISTKKSDVDALFDKQDLNRCERFSWRNGVYLPTGASLVGPYKNTAPAPTDTVLRVYRLAQKEMSLPYTTAQVAKDDEAKMWRVNFSTMEGPVGSVYLNDDGTTHLVVFYNSDTLNDQELRQTVDTCKQITENLQGTDVFSLHTFYDFCGNALNEWTDDTIYVHGWDWMNIAKLQDGDSYSVNGQLFQDGTYFDNQGQAWDENDNPNWKEATLPADGHWNFSQPWLLKCNWDRYIISVLSDTRGEDGGAIGLYFTPKDPQQDSMEYEASFHFDGKGVFQWVDVECIQAGQTVQKQTTEILGYGVTDWDEIGRIIDEQYQRATN